MAMVPAGDGAKGGSNDGNSGGRQPKQHIAPKSYEEILKFAVENTTPGGDVHQAMSDERKQWLSEALSGMFTDEVKILKKKLAALASIASSDKEEDQEQKKFLLEYVTDICDNIDNARDFVKVDGMNVVSPCLDDPSSEIRWRALEVMATILQNNPFVQDSLLEQNIMQKFINMADEDSDPTVKVKAVYALSCHVREHEASMNAFVNSDGFSCLLRAMQRNHEKLQIKAAFLLKAILITQPKLRDNAQQIGMVQQLVGLLNTEHTSAHEHMVAALLCLVTDHPQSLVDCRQPELNLQELIEGRLALTKDKEEFQEEYQYCQELKTMVFAPDQDSNQSAER